MKPGTLALSWGKWGGFYRGNSAAVKRLTVGCFALTWLPKEIDDYMKSYAAGTEVPHPAAERLAERGVLN